MLLFTEISTGISLQVNGLFLLKRIRLQSDIYKCQRHKEEVGVKKKKFDLKQCTESSNLQIKIVNRPFYGWLNLLIEMYSLLSVKERMNFYLQHSSSQYSAVNLNEAVMMSAGQDNKISSRCSGRALIFPQFPR